MLGEKDIYRKKGTTSGQILVKIGGGRPERDYIDDRIITSHSGHHSGQILVKTEK
jgi:hypothetical protein